MLGRFVEKRLPNHEMLADLFGKDKATSEESITQTPPAHVQADHKVKGMHLMI